MRVGNLDGIAHNLTVKPLGTEPQHQRVRKWPGLAADVTHVAYRDAHFFQCLANDRFFQRLAWFDEPRKTGIHRLLPLHTAGEQRLLCISLATRDQSDDGRV